jgi:hypothetical protein
MSGSQLSLLYEGTASLPWWPHLGKEIRTLPGAHGNRGNRCMGHGPIRYFDSKCVPNV